MSVAAPDLLTTIVAATRTRVEVQAARVPLDVVRAQAEEAPPARWGSPKRWRGAIA